MEGGGGGGGGKVYTLARQRGGGREGTIFASPSKQASGEDRGERGGRGRRDGSYPSTSAKKRGKAFEPSSLVPLREKGKEEEKRSSARKGIFYSRCLLARWRGGKEKKGGGGGVGKETLSSSYRGEESKAEIKGERRP